MTINTKRAERKLDEANKMIFIGAGIASRRGAELLRRELQNNVPVDTGRFRDSFRLTHLRSGWFVRVPRRRFPQFFYPRLFISLLAAVSKRVARRVQVKMKLELRHYLNARL